MKIDMTIDVEHPDQISVAALYPPGMIDTLEQSTRGAINSVIADAQRSVKRLLKRAAVPEDYERVTFKQDKGPTIEATVRLLGSTSFEITGRQTLEITLEIYETAAGALLAVSASTLPGGTGREDLRVTVVPPTDDVLAMRTAVMDAFDWSVYARSMARKLGWNLIQEVD